MGVGEVISLLSYIDKGEIKSTVVDDNSSDGNRQNNVYNTGAATNKSELVYNMNGYDVLFETNGSEILSMKYKYNYNTVEKANSEFQFLCSYLSGNSNIENVVLNGNSVEIIFKDNVFENVSVESMLDKNLIGGMM